MKTHGTQNRASGDPYFSHRSRSPASSPSCGSTPPPSSPALLHDMIEDTDVTCERSTRLFGDEIAGLVDGVTKLSQLELQSEQHQQAENFRKLVLAMSARHPRAAGQAGRPAAQHAHAALHHGPGKRRRIAARDDGDLRAARRAHRHGAACSDELEELAFAELDPRRATPSSARLELPARAGRATWSPRSRPSSMRDADGGGHRGRGLGPREDALFDLAQDAAQERRLRAALRHHGVPRHRRRRRATATARWASMHRRYPGGARAVQGLHLHAQAQRLPLAAHRRDRARAASASRCRSAPREMHEHGRERRRRALALQAGRRRRPTRRQYRLAARACWTSSSTARRRGVPRAHQARDVPGPGVLLHAEGRADRAAARRDADRFRLRRAQPGRRHLRRRQDQRPHDAAAHAARRTATRSRSSPSKAQTPSPTWERFVVTGKARARDPPLHPHAAARAVSWSSAARCSTRRSARRATRSPKRCSTALKTLQAGERSTTCMSRSATAMIGAREVLNAVYPGLQASAGAARSRADLAPRAGRQAGTGARRDAVPITGLIPGMAVHFAGCCHPLPGDRIVGIVTTGKGVTIHTIDCDTLESFADTPERWIDVGWDAVGDGGAAYTGRHQGDGRQPAGQPRRAVHRDRPARGQHLQPARSSTARWISSNGRIDVEVADVEHLATSSPRCARTPAINAVEARRAASHNGSTLLKRTHDVHQPLRLGVNIDHVATIRNARGGRHPDPLRAAAIAARGRRRRHHRPSARGPPPHLRCRHRRGCCASIDLPLNFEMAATRRRCSRSRCSHRPHAACIVPEKREERTTEGGLDVARPAQPPDAAIVARLQRRRHPRLAVHRGRPRQIEAAATLGAPVVELHTGAYCERATGDGAQAAELARLRRRAAQARAARPRVPRRPRPRLRRRSGRSRRSPRSSSSTSAIS